MEKLLMILPLLTFIISMIALFILASLFRPAEGGFSYFRRVLKRLGEHDRISGDNE